LGSNVSATSPASITHAAIGRCLDAYQQAFVERFQLPPHITPGKDAKLLRQLLTLWGEADVLQLLALFFETPDSRVQASSYTVGAFYYEAQRLKLHGGTGYDQITRDNLAAAARACGFGRSIP